MHGPHVVSRCIGLLYRSTASKARTGCNTVFQLTRCRELCVLPTLQDLKLRQPPWPQQQPGSPPAKRKAASVGASTGPAPSAEAATPGTPAAKPCDGAPGTAQATAPPVPATSAGPAASGGGDTSSPEPPAFEAVWSADGAGPAAAALLRKLRWLTVGPRYDWTARAYDFGGPHHPLPGYAADLARRLVAAVEAAKPREARPAQQRHGGEGATAGASEQARQHVQQGALQGCASGLGWADSQLGAAAPLNGRCTCQQHRPGPGHGQLQSSHSCTDGQAQPMPQVLRMHGDTPCQPTCAPQQPPSQPPQHQQRQAEALPALPAVCHACQPAWQQQQQHSEAGPAAFTPDAALVCFYRAGDTLCGHRDDVERDVTQVCGEPLFFFFFLACQNTDGSCERINSVLARSIP